MEKMFIWHRHDCFVFSNDEVAKSFATILAKYLGVAVVETTLSGVAVSS
jgi:hypothetical protein